HLVSLHDALPILRDSEENEAGSHARPGHDSYHTQGLNAELLDTATQQQPVRVAFCVCLSDAGLGAEQTYCEHTPDTREAMDRNGADRIIDLQLVECLDAEHNND